MHIKLSSRDKLIVELPSAYVLNSFSSYGQIFSKVKSSETQSVQTERENELYFYSLAIFDGRNRKSRTHDCKCGAP